MTTNANAARKTKTLFLGNSFTKCSAFDIPSEIDRLAARVGGGVRHESLAEHGACVRNGMPLSYYLNDRGGRLGDYLKGEGEEDPPTHVVLQEQSCKPWRSPAKFREAVKGLASKFRTLYPECQIVLYQTQCWAALDEKHCKTYKEQTDRLLGGYRDLARELDIVMAPVGEAVEVMRAERRQWPVSAEDGRHPTPLAAYLAACLFLRVLTGKKSALIGDGEDDNGESNLLPEQVRYVHDLADRTMDRYYEQRGEGTAMVDGRADTETRMNNRNKRKQTSKQMKSHRKKQIVTRSKQG